MSSEISVELCSVDGNFSREIKMSFSNLNHLIDAMKTGRFSDDDSYYRYEFHEVYIGTEGKVCCSIHLDEL